MKKIYLATPYTHKDENVMEQRFFEVTKVAAQLLNEGYNVYSPITHSHILAKYHSLPTNWEFWKMVDTDYIEWADEVWILCLECWEKSIGVSEETIIAKKLNKEIKYLDPKEF